MAQLVPLFLDTGSIEVVSGSKVADYIHFPVTASNIPGSYNTLLPDPYLFVTMSANITNAANTTSSSLFQFKVPGRVEKYFYAHNSIVGVQTSATTTGVRIGLQTNSPLDGIANIKVSSTLTAHTIACIGSNSPTTFALPASMAAINTIYPCFVKGLYNNSTSSVPINNVVLLQPETNNTVTANSGSVSYNKFVGYSSSANIINEKSIPLYFSTGSLKTISGSDTISASFLPPTASLWFSQSLAANVANTSNTAYATVFTLTGLTTGKTYLANLYMIGVSAAAATGFRMRVTTGSAYRGTLYIPTSTTAPAIQNSADGNNITSIAAGTWPTVNTKYLVYGDYTFVKAAQDPQVQILSETNGTAVTAFSGSIIYYRQLD
jgi:hypothetical protein